MRRRKRFEWQRCQSEHVLFRFDRLVYLGYALLGRILFNRLGSEFCCLDPIIGFRRKLIDSHSLKLGIKSASFLIFKWQLRGELFCAALFGKFRNAPVQFIRFLRLCVQFIFFREIIEFAIAFLLLGIGKLDRRFFVIIEPGFKRVEFVRFFRSRIERFKFNGFVEFIFVGVFDKFSSKFIQHRLLGKSILQFILDQPRGKFLLHSLFVELRIKFFQFKFIVKFRIQFALFLQFRVQFGSVFQPGIKRIQFKFFIEL